MSDVFSFKVVSTANEHLFNSFIPVLKTLLNAALKIDDFKIFILFQFQSI